MTSTDPLPGTRDRMGAELRRRDYIAETFLHTAYAWGYERLAVPLLERASSFSEAVIGRSPWPEWNPLGVFTLPVTGYVHGYTEEAESIPAVVIPEGTVSVARWLAGQIQEAGAGALPVKVCYDLPCHRNEPLDTLTGTKLREFSQLGLEILGASNEGADTEVITFIYDVLTALGVAPTAIRARINNVRIFTRAAADSGLDHETTIAVKEILDALAECRAGKEPGRAPDLHKAFHALLDARQLDVPQRAMWSALAGHATGHVDEETRTVLGPRYTVELDALEAMRTALLAAGIPTIVDLAVVRSHEYYTGTSFEVDVTTGGGRVYAEIAGGGRYDKLIGHFLSEGQMDAVPSTGFAFGVERLQALLADLGVFDNPASARAAVYRFDAASAEALLVPRGDAGSVDGYLRARACADRSRRRVDVWVGDRQDHATVADYAQAHGIGQVEWC
jgi:histidyl-tRNA synthetase